MREAIQKVFFTFHEIKSIFLRDLPSIVLKTECLLFIKGYEGLDFDWLKEFLQDFLENDGDHTIISDSWSLISPKRKLELLQNLNFRSKFMSMGIVNIDNLVKFLEVYTVEHPKICLDILSVVSQELFDSYSYYSVTAKSLCDSLKKSDSKKTVLTGITSLRRCLILLQWILPITRQCVTMYQKLDSTDDVKGIEALLESIEKSISDIERSIASLEQHLNFLYKDSQKRKEEKAANMSRLIRHEMRPRFTQLEMPKIISQLKHDQENKFIPSYRAIFNSVVQMTPLHQQQISLLNSAPLKIDPKLFLN
jgi:hypothetical protein